MMSVYHIKQLRFECVMHTMTLSMSGKKMEEFLSFWSTNAVASIYHIYLFWVVLIWAGSLLSTNFSQFQHIDLSPILLWTKMFRQVSSVYVDLDMKDFIVER